MVGVFWLSDRGRALQARLWEEVDRRDEAERFRRSDDADSDGSEIMVRMLHPTSGKHGFAALLARVPHVTRGDRR